MRNKELGFGAITSMWDWERRNTTASFACLNFTLKFFLSKLFRHAFWHLFKRMCLFLRTRPSDYMSVRLSTRLFGFLSSLQSFSKFRLKIRHDNIQPLKHGTQRAFQENQRRAVKKELRTHLSFNQFPSCSRT